MLANADRRWVNDEQSQFCTNCNDQFTFLNRKHHCRACGKLLCHACACNWLLIPSDHRAVCPGKVDDVTNPQRCCHTCARVLQSKQEELLATNCKANTELRIERTGNERYANPPVSRKFETDIRKATYTLYNFTSDNVIEGQDAIPKELIVGAKGLVFCTVLKAGFLFSGRVGTGLVIARLKDGSWSAPSAIMLTGVGWGLQAGGEVTDVMLILTTQSAVDAFTSDAQVSVGTELAVSLGPVGRSAGTDLHAGSEGASAAFSYAHSKGLFCGVSLEASVFAVRQDINRNFYGTSVQPAALLNGSVPRPKAAEPLYHALQEVVSSSGADGSSTSSAPSFCGQHGTYSYITAAGGQDDDDDESDAEEDTAKNQWISAVGAAIGTRAGSDGKKQFSDKSDHNTVPPAVTRRKRSSSGEGADDNGLPFTNYEAGCGVERVAENGDDGTELKEINRNGSFGKTAVRTSYSDLSVLALNDSIASEYPVSESVPGEKQRRSQMLPLPSNNRDFDNDSSNNNSDSCDEYIQSITDTSKPIALVAAEKPIFTAADVSSVAEADDGKGSEVAPGVASSMHYEEIRF